MSCEAYVLLEDGARFDGVACAADRFAVGEIVFTTSMSGYQEAVTDPSYAGQLLVFTYPQVGNYGVRHEAMESDRIHARAAIMRAAVNRQDSPGAEQGWLSWLEQSGVPAISEVDTRALVRHIRRHGAMGGGLFPAGVSESRARALIEAEPPMTGRDLVPTVTLAQRTVLEGSGPRIVILDTGVKRSIVSELRSRGATVELHPSTASASELLDCDPDAVLLGNGPGDPGALGYIVDTVRGLIGRVPVYGICLGHQLLCRAVGLETYKLPFGHHGANHPVKELVSATIEITSQNHGFAVVGPDGSRKVDRDEAIRWETEFGVAELTHINLYDRTVEGLRMCDVPAATVQYHPEAGPGPHDALHLFDRFIAGARCDMPRRDDLHKILLIGSGPIVIGQAAEFDYSGTQACRVLMDEGYEVVLVNSNPATIMTDPELATATYIEPLQAPSVAQVIERERPDALLPTLGGQTALNLSKELHELGVLERYEVELIGADYEAIGRAEDRARFRETMTAAGLRVPRSAIVRSVVEARAEVERLGLPFIVRPAFTLGGTGGGVVRSERELERVVGRGLAISPIHQVLVEESVLGWGEFELEVMRDGSDNVVIVCSIENIDPMGVHTGDSVCVAPQQTLSDRAYQELRNQAITVIRAVGVQTGGSNVQFAVDPRTDEVVVIEMNPRVSRSSALASKATGFPIAKIAARLAVGYTLQEIPNDITRATPASFEPALDYCVVKWPRFAFEKFPGAEPWLTTHMKSVGEVMSIGRTFKQAFAKALRSRELDSRPRFPDSVKELVEAVERPGAERFDRLLEALRRGASVKELHARTRIHPWFLNEFAELVAERQKPAGQRTFKAVDTCAAEFEARTPYYYSSWERPARLAGASSRDGRIGAERTAPTGSSTVIILGSGPNRIGQGIEFDYCCVHAAQTVRESGRDAVMINCNPETVSTDYDVSDRLYFEPLTLEDVLAVCGAEGAGHGLRVDDDRPSWNGWGSADDPGRSRDTSGSADDSRPSREAWGNLEGVVVQFGGQTPLKLAAGLHAAGVPILGTTVEAIDLAEDRSRFGPLLDRLGFKAPPYATARSVEEALDRAPSVGFPLLVRPSYVLGGRAMEIVYTDEGLRKYLDRVELEPGRLIYLDRFLEDSIEIDVDAMCDGSAANGGGGQVWIAGIMQHVEEAGIHSGDSACVLPPHALGEEMLTQVQAQTAAIALELGVVGLLNVQFAIHGDTLYVIEANPRASRTVPFVSKAIGVPIAKLACRLMLGDRLADLDLPQNTANGHVCVKEVVLPFERFAGADSLLGPEMRSTGEVMGIAADFPTAFAKAQAATGSILPLSGTVFVTVTDGDKPAATGVASILHDLSFKIVATRGTAQAIRKMGIPAETINKLGEGSPHVVDWIERGDVDLIVNTPVGTGARADGYEIRTAAMARQIPCITTMAGAMAAARAIAAARRGAPVVRSLQEIHRSAPGRREPAAARPA